MGDDLTQAIQKIKELLFDDDEFKEQLKDLVTITGFNDLLNSFVVFWSVLNKLVQAIEKVYKEYHLISEEQRIEAAAEILDDLITFRGWLSIFEPFDTMLFKLLISAAVQALNDKYGHGNWP